MCVGRTCSGLASPSTGCSWTIGIDPRVNELISRGKPGDSMKQNEDSWDVQDERVRHWFVFLNNSNECGRSELCFFWIEKKYRKTWKCKVWRLVWSWNERVVHFCHGWCKGVIFYWKQWPICHLFVTIGKVQHRQAKAGHGFHVHLFDMFPYLKITWN